MPGHTVIKGYQIGYRLCQVEHTETWCSCSYTDFPMHRVEDFSGIDGIQCAEYTLRAAQLLLDAIRTTFWVVDAEWRIVECWE